MPSQIKALIVTIALAKCALALGNAVVTNNCDFNVYLWSVGGSIVDKGPLQKGNSYSEEFHRDFKSGGVTLKITTVPDGIYNNKPETDFAYNLDSGAIWYDLSDVNGDPFAGHKLAMTSASTACPSTVWPNGTPDGTGTENCPDTNANVTLTLCAE